MKRFFGLTYKTMEFLFVVLVADAIVCEIKPFFRDIFNVYFPLAPETRSLVTGFMAGVLVCLLKFILSRLEKKGLSWNKERK